VELKDGRPGPACRDTETWTFPRWRLDGAGHGHSAGPVLLSPSRITLDSLKRPAWRSDIPTWSRLRKSPPGPGAPKPEQLTQGERFHVRTAAVERHTGAALRVGLVLVALGVLALAAYLLLAGASR
jgi:hypothetical protein